MPPCTTLWDSCHQAQASLPGTCFWIFLLSLISYNFVTCAKRSFIITFFTRTIAIATSIISSVTTFLNYSRDRSQRLKTWTQDLRTILHWKSTCDTVHSLFVVDKESTLSVSLDSVHWSYISACSSYSLFTHDDVKVHSKYFERKLEVVHEWPVHVPLSLLVGVANDPSWQILPSLLVLTMHAYMYNRTADIVVGGGCCCDTRRRYISCTTDWVRGHMHVRSVGRSVGPIKLIIKKKHC